ncbi:MAG: ribosome recycling factor [Candidatus Saccharibacteria bacterium]|nr:ribosome recycling factor [Candidatus Saccharibacteria bacterium]
MFDTKEEEVEMGKVLERFLDELKKLRTGRAHPDMLAGLKVEAYGEFMPMNQVANVTVGGATMLLVTPYDPGNIQAIEAAIRKDQNLGLNPADDGKVIRVPIPALTEERRKEIVKMAEGKAEEARIQLRKIRDEGRKDLKKAELAEDAKKRGEKELDEMAKKFSEQIETALKEKSAEIMKI